MSTTTTTRPTTTTTPAEIDSGVAQELGDEILLDMARAERVKQVAKSGRRDSLQSHTARAWSRGGDVD